MKDALTQNARLMEDAFFLEHDRLLLKKRQEMHQMKETRQALAEASGITNHQILDKFIALNIPPTTVASLGVIPLVAIAWADNRVDAKEREAILKHAKVNGFKKGSLNYDLLEEWLHKRPTPELMKAWEHYIEGLKELLTPEEIIALEKDLLQKAEAVAKASGGFMFLKPSIAPEEQKILDQLVKAFRK